jgi:hypothetical protein
MLTQTDVRYEQVERLLQSATFRNAEVLRRLLKFLADKSIAGDAEQLKEYTIAVDGLGKSASYDPRQDSLVRIEISRLRGKLADYYRTEGEHDSLVLAIPKGRFKPTWERRPPPAQPSLQPPISPSPSVARAQSARAKAYAIMVVILIAWALSATILLWRQQRAIHLFGRAWTPELQELWRPFVESNRPLIVAVTAPLFVGLQGHGFYRDQDLNQWDQVLSSPDVEALRKALNNPPIVPRYYYTGLGEMSASFQLGRLLGNSGLDISTTWSNTLSWQQIVNDNILFVGPPRVFGNELQKLPVNLALVLREDGIHDLKADPKGPALYADNYPSIGAQKLSVPDDGEVYALISRMPGPLGSGYIQSFSSNHSPGTEGALQFFTEPRFAGELIEKLGVSNGHLPRFFQVVVDVRYRDAVPIEISYVTSRDLQLRRTSSTAN